MTKRRLRTVSPARVLTTRKLIDLATGVLPDSDIPDKVSPREVRVDGCDEALAKAQAAVMMVQLALVSRAYALALPDADRERVRQQIVAIWRGALAAEPPPTSRSAGLSDEARQALQVAVS